MSEKRERKERSADKKTVMSKEKKNEYLAEIELLRKEIIEKDDVIAKASAVIETTRKEYEDLAKEYECAQILVKKIDRERNEHLQELKELRKELERESKKKKAQKQKTDKEFAKNPKNLTNFQSKEELIDNMNELLEENSELTKTVDELNQEVKEMREKLLKLNKIEESFKLLQKEHEQSKGQVLSLKNEKKWLQDKLNSEVEQPSMNTKASSKTPTKTVKKERHRISPQTTRGSPPKENSKLKRLELSVEESDLLREWLKEHERVADLKNQGLSQNYLQDLLQEEKLMINLNETVSKEADRAKRFFQEFYKHYDNVTPLLQKITEERQEFDRVTRDLKEKLSVTSGMIAEYQKQIIEWQDAFNQMLSIHEIEKSELESNIDLLKIEINERDKLVVSTLVRNADTFDELLKESREKCYSVFETFEEMKEKNKSLSRQKYNLSQRVQELEKPEAFTNQRDFLEIHAKIIEIYSSSAFKKEQLLLGKENFDKLLGDMISKVWDLSEINKLRGNTKPLSARGNSQCECSSIQKELEGECKQLREQISSFNKEKEAIISQINKYEVLFDKVNLILEEGEEKIDRLEREKEEYKKEIARLRIVMERPAHAEARNDGSLFFEKSKGADHFESFRLSFDGISMSHNQELYPYEAPRIDEISANSTIPREIRDFEVRETPPRHIPQDSGAKAKFSKSNGKLINLEDKLNRVRQQEQLLKKQLEALEKKKDV